jgi:hypothetical protein
LAKKGFRKIPEGLLSKVAALAVDDVVVACVKRLEPGQIASYAHLGLKLLASGQLDIPAPFVPPPSHGRASHTNVNGRVVIRKDLPKVYKTFTIEVPNWGDWSNGSHDLDQTRLVYERDFIPPKDLTLSIERIGLSTSSTGFILKFTIDQVISKAAEDFEEDFLYNLNLLQENVGTADVFASNTSHTEFEVTIHVDWELLPPGNLDEIVRRMLDGKRPVSEQQRTQIRERLAVLGKLNPRRYIAGTSEFLRYFGAQFEDNFVVFENITYGNAMYVMYEDWEALSKRSRIDLLKGPRDGFDRVVHTDGWGDRVALLLRKHRE